MNISISLGPICSMLAIRLLPGYFKNRCPSHVFPLHVFLRYAACIISYYKDKKLHNTGIILCMGRANKRRHYNVTLSLIGWAHTQNNSYNIMKSFLYQNDIKQIFNSSTSAKTKTAHKKSISKQCSLLAIKGDVTWWPFLELLCWYLIIKLLKLLQLTWRSGSCLNIKTVFPRYGDSHVKDKTVARPSYL